MYATAPTIELSEDRGDSEGVRIHASLENLVENHQYSVTCAFFHDQETSVAGFVRMGDEPVSALEESEEYHDQLEISTSSEGSWDGALECLPDYADDRFRVDDGYSLQVGMFIDDSDDVVWSDPLQVTLGKPDPLADVEVLEEDSPELEATEPAINLQIHDEDIDAGEIFEITAQYQNIVPGTYWVKVQGSHDQASWYDARTVGKDEKLYAWNAAWENHPKIVVKEDHGEFEVQGVIDDDINGSVYVRLKLQQEEGKKSFESDVITVSVREKVIPEAEQNVGDQQDSSVAANNDNTPVDVPASIYFIDEAKALSLDTKVLVEGVVTSPIGQLGSRVLYVEDQTGGVKVLVRDKTRNDIQYSDRVMVTGILKEAYNELYIKVQESEDLVVIEKGDPPSGLDLETGQIGERNEGRVVTVDGTVTATSGNTFYVDDGSGAARVYIKSTTSIDKPPMRQGYYTKVTGIVSQYKEDYRLLPRFQEDVQVGQTVGQVLGASDQKEVLPKTGYSNFFIGWVIVIAGIGIRVLAALMNNRKSLFIIEIM